MMSPSAWNEKANARAGSWTRSQTRSLTKALRPRSCANSANRHVSWTSSAGSVIAIAASAMPTVDPIARPTARQPAAITTPASSANPLARALASRHREASVALYLIISGWATAPRRMPTTTT